MGFFSSLGTTKKEQLLKYYTSHYVCLFYIYIVQWLYTEDWYPIHPPILQGSVWWGRNLLGEGLRISAGEI